MQRDGNKRKSQCQRTKESLGRHRGNKEDKTTAIQYKGSEEMKEFLSKSIVGEKLRPVNVEMLLERLFKD